jgi:PAS domain S-box-containing protein
MKGTVMKAVRFARLTAASARGVGGLQAAIEDLRRRPSHRLLVVAIVASTAMVAALDLWTSGELVGSILFTVPLALCALQSSKKLLWSTAAAAGVLTLAAGVWGHGRAGVPTSLDGMISRTFLVVSLFALTAFIHLWLRKARLGALDATEIRRQSDSLADQNIQLEALIETATHDIAVRQEADKHLAQMEARYRGLLEAAPDAMVVVDQAGAIVLLNLQAEKQFGYRRDELVGQQVKTVIPEGFAERLIADDARTAAEALAQQIGTGLELIGRRKDGSEFPMELMLSPLESDGGILVTAAIRDIGVRRAAEEHLAQMEARYRGLLEAAPDAMVVVNQIGEIVILNLQAEQQFGYRRDELLGLPVKNIIPEGFAERLIADGTRTAAEALAQQIGTGLELIGRRKDGSEFPIELMLSPLENADGILVTAAIRDIGVRKEAEEHLAQMEARYRGLLEAAPDGMVVVNQTGEIVILNLQAEKQFGYRRDELLGLPVKTIIPEGFAERLIADGTRSPAEALAQQIGSGIELIGRRKDGSEFPMELMLSPLQDADGFLVTAAIRDVTARHADQDALRASEEWHRMAVEVTELGTWVWDIASGEATWSARFKAIYGLTPKAILTRQGSLGCVHPEDRKRVERGLDEAVARHTAFDMEYRIIWADGSEHWVSSKGRVRRAADGAAESLQGAVLDITERRAGEESLRERPALERTSAELMRSNADLQQFAYVAAHDLQEPLRMVSSYTQLLAKRYKGRLDPNADEFIAFAVDGAQRMQLLISDLLSYCQVGTAGQAFSETSASDALALALQNLHGAIEESGGSVTRDKLPTLIADHAQLVQLFQNLVGNALKYRGPAPPRVHVSAKKNAAREWVFSVRDNGLGIEPKYFTKIFLMFQRLHGREEFSGTGIGLSLCKKIAERHGGRIWVKSAAAGGSTFFVAFPEARV